MVMVSPNEVEETRVWTGYSNISSKHHLFQNVLST